MCKFKWYYCKIIHLLWKYWLGDSFPFKGDLSSSIWISLTSYAHQETWVLGQHPIILCADSSAMVSWVNQSLLSLPHVHHILQSLSEALGPSSCSQIPPHNGLGCVARALPHAPTRGWETCPPTWSRHVIVSRLNDLAEGKRAHVPVSLLWRAHLSRVVQWGMGGPPESWQRESPGGVRLWWGPGQSFPLALQAKSPPTTAAAGLERGPDFRLLRSPSVALPGHPGKCMLGARVPAHGGAWWCPALLSSGLPAWVQPTCWSPEPPGVLLSPAASASRSLTPRSCLSPFSSSFPSVPQGKDGLNPASTGMVSCCPKSERTAVQRGT